MRFVFISTMSGSPWGGSEELWSQAALRLRREGHAVAASVLWWPQLSPKILALKEAGIPILAQKNPDDWGIAESAWHAGKRRLGVPDRTAKWLTSQKPDLVIISQGSASDGLKRMDLCRRMNLPYASIVQSNRETWWPLDAVSEKLSNAYQSARKVFCVSRHNLELLENQVGLALPNATVVWNPFNVPAEQPPAWPTENGVWKMACVARLEPAAKGQDVLFEVLALPHWKERPIGLHIFGTGISENVLRRLAQKLKLQLVRFCGHVQDVKSIWEQNQLLILPSRFEGLPLALVEAMWCARPALVTDVGGNAEVCQDGETGFVAAAPTVALLDQAMERAWNCRGEWQRIGLAARRRAEKLVPKDPVADFCRHLLQCTGKSA